MKIFNYFKNRKTGNPKKENEKIFRIVIIIFFVMIIYGIISGSAGGTLKNQLESGAFKFAVSDGIILAGIAFAYAAARMKGGRK